MAVKYRYTGAGAFLPELPARDLTDDDLAALTDQQRALLDAHMQLEPAARVYEPAAKKPSGGEG